jgi:hypothetical protein
LDAAALKLLEPRAEPRVKVAAMEILSVHRKMEALDKILPLLTHEAFPSVQIAACRALAYIPDAKSVPVLLKYLDGFKKIGNGRLMYEATAALRTITGQKFEADSPDWAKWWKENQAGFKVDLSNKVEPEFNYELAAGGEVSYYGIPVCEQKIVFVIDISGSMQLGGNPNRWDSASKELKKLIEKLDQRQSFNIIAFASGTNRWKRKEALVPATDVNKKEASKFIDTLHPNGGTQTTDVLEDVIRDIASVQGCEAIYLVTDGSPNPWSKEITSPMQSRYITWFNQAWKVRIITFGIYTTTDQEKKGIARNEDTDGMKEYLYFIASNNDGTYREIGK